MLEFLLDSSTVDLLTIMTNSRSSLTSLAVTGAHAVRPVTVTRGHAYDGTWVRQCPSIRAIACCAGQVSGV